MHAQARDVMGTYPWSGQAYEASSARLDYGAPLNPDLAQNHNKFRVLGRAVDWLIDLIAPCPWTAAAGSNVRLPVPYERRTLYSAEERRRRDSTVWTTVQGVLAPIQFGVFLVSLCLVVNYLSSGRGYAIATASVVVKTGVLYTIMITGSIWEKKVFGKYLFAPAFFWEDAVSMLVIALHTAYLSALWSGWGSANGLMTLALAAYTAYAINAAQFILKLRAARLEAPSTRGQSR
jgi:3-vinyl bacteriochlorophyllide hydratase